MAENETIGSLWMESFLILNCLMFGRVNSLRCHYSCLLLTEQTTVLYEHEEAEGEDVRIRCSLQTR